MIRITKAPYVTGPFRGGSIAADPYGMWVPSRNSDPNNVFDPGAATFAQIADVSGNGRHLTPTGAFASNLWSAELVTCGSKTYYTARAPTGSTAQWYGWDSVAALGAEDGTIDAFTVAWVRPWDVGSAHNGTAFWVNTSTGGGVRQGTLSDVWDSFAERRGPVVRQATTIDASWSDGLFLPQTLTPDLPREFLIGSGSDPNAPTPPTVDTYIGYVWTLSGGGVDAEETHTRIGVADWGAGARYLGAVQLSSTAPTTGPSSDPTKPAHFRFGRQLRDFWFPNDGTIFGSRGAWRREITPREGAGTLAGFIGEDFGAARQLEAHAVLLAGLDADGLL